MRTNSPFSFYSSENLSFEESDRSELQLNILRLSVELKRAYQDIRVNYRNFYNNQQITQVSQSNQQDIQTGQIIKLSLECINNFCEYTEYLAVWRLYASTHQNLNCKKSITNIEKHREDFTECLSVLLSKLPDNMRVKAKAYLTWLNDKKLRLNFLKFSKMYENIEEISTRLSLNRIMNEKSILYVSSLNLYFEKAYEYSQQIVNLSTIDVKKQSDFYKTNTRIQGISIIKLSRLKYDLLIALSRAPWPYDIWVNSLEQQQATSANNSSTLSLLSNNNNLEGSFNSLGLPNIKEETEENMVMSITLVAPAFNSLNIIPSGRGNISEERGAINQVRDIPEEQSVIDQEVEVEGERVVGIGCGEALKGLCCCILLMCWFGPFSVGLSVSTIF